MSIKGFNAQDLSEGFMLTINKYIKSELTIQIIQVQGEYYAKQGIDYKTE